MLWQFFTAKAKKAKEEEPRRARRKGRGERAGKSVPGTRGRGERAGKCARHEGGERGGKRRATETRCVRLYAVVSFFTTKANKFALTLISPLLTKVSFSGMVYSISEYRRLAGGFWSVQEIGVPK
jgi:hypothetical protein